MSDKKLGPVEIEFVLDRKAETQARSLKSKLDEVAATGKKGSAEYNKELKRELGLIEDIEKELVKLREKQKKAHSVEDIEKYNRKIKEAEMHLAEYNKAGLKSADTTSTLTQSISKWALSLGGAVAGLALLKDALQETSGGMNMFNRVAEVKDQVLYDIVSGQGLSSTRAGLASRLAGKKNEQRWQDYVDDYTASKYERKYQQLYTETLDASLSIPDKIAKIDEALAAHDKSIEIKMDNIKRNLQLNEEARALKPQKEKLIKEYFDLNKQLEEIDKQRYEGTKRLVRQRSLLEQQEWDEKLKRWHKEIEEQNDAREKIAEAMKKLEQLKKENEQYGAIIDPGSILTKARTLGEPLRKSNVEKYTEQETERREKLAKKDQERIDNAMKLVGHMSDLNAILYDQGILTEDAARQMDIMVSTVERLISGDLAGAALGVIQSLIIGIQQTFPGVMQRESERLQTKIAEINRLLEEQRRLIGLSERKGGQSEARQGEADLIQEQIDVNNAAISRYRKILNSPWRSPKAKREAAQAIQDLIDKNMELQISLEESRQALTDLFSGGITENRLADMFTEAYRSGKTSARDLADFTKQVLTEAVEDVFSQKILGPALTEAQGMIAEALKDGILSSEERSSIEKKIADLGAKYKEMWDPLASALGLGSEANTALSGAIKGITEQTASVLAGQMNAIRISQADSNSVIKKQLLHLAEIAVNTRHLESIDNKLDALKNDSLRAQGVL